MKIKYLYQSGLFLCTVLMVAMTSCTPDDYSLGQKMNTNELKFSVTQNPDDPNMIILTSQTDGVVPVWTTPSGQSTEDIDTLKIAFAGDYNIIYGVETPGGYVQSTDTTHILLTSNNFDYVNDPLWTLLSGGVGESKTWYLDLDAEGISRSFNGPIWFFTDSYAWDNLHSSSGGNYIDSKTWAATDAIVPNVGDDGSTATWFWESDWPGNTWICNAADFGTMTFDLKDGANVQVDQKAYGLNSYSGTYFLDADDHTIQFTNSYPLHDSSRDADVKAATEFRVLYLSDDCLQIFVPSVGVSYNYISKEYRDKWNEENGAE